ncbi:MAG: peptidylprolyl isomerase [Aequorivita sp.]
MAILNNIRKRGIFLILIIALALFAFILSDILTSGGGGGPKGQNNIATINGTDISRQSFMEEVETMQRNMGPSGSTAQAMSTVWDRELRRVIFDEQIEKVGISVEKAQLDNALKSALANNPTFLNEAGQVDDGRIQEYIASIKASSPQMYQQWIQFEESASQDILLTTYYNLIRGGLRSTIAEGEQDYHFQNDKININYALVPYSKFEDSDFKVSDDEIKKYVSAHPNDFQTEAKADLQYVLFSEEPSQGDIEAAEKATAALLDNQIVYNPETQTNDTIPGFRTTKDYEEFVNANSDEPYYDGWTFKSQLPPTLADTLMNLNTGDIYGPFKLENTYNLVKVLETKKTPDSADSKHILIRFLGTLRAPETVTRTKEEAKKLADSILGVVRKDKTKFAELASEFSDDSSKEMGGELGSSTPGRMVPPFDEFIFNNPTGTIGVIETDFGYHVVEVGKQSEPKKAIKLATVTKHIEASEKSINDVFSQASKFEVAVLKGNFDEIAKDQNLDIRPVNRIGIMDATIPGIENNRTMVNWAFNEDTKIGDTKRFSIPDGYVIAQLTRKNPKGLLPVSEARAIVEPILLKEKKAKKIRETIQGSTIEEIAKSQGVGITPATDVTLASPMLAGKSEPKVVGWAFGTKAGETTPLIDGNEGVYIVKVLAFNPAPNLESYVNQANQLSGRAAPNAPNQVFNALKKKAKIVDHRANFY